MRIVILTTDEHFSHFFLSRILRSHQQNIERVFVERASVKKFGPLKTFWQVWKRSGGRYAWAAAAEAILYTIVMATKRFLGINRVENFFDAAVIAGVPVERIENANNSDFIAELRALQPDLLVLVRYNRIISGELIKTPKLATLNLHTGLLPRYRGLTSTLNSMIRQEALAGATLHKVTEKIDGGDILGKIMIPIDYKESALVNQFMVMEVGARLFRRTIRAIVDCGEIIAEPQPRTGNYFGWPPKKDIKCFLRSGGKLIKFKDIVFLWRNL